MTSSDDRVCALAWTFEAHALGEVPEHYLHTLDETARMNAAADARRRRNAGSNETLGWPQESRTAARAHATALLKYATGELLPRDAETPRRRRRQLAALLNQLYATVALTAAGFNPRPLVDALQRGRPRQGDLKALDAAIAAMPPAKRTGRPNAAYVRLIRGTALAWLDCGRSESFGGGLTVTAAGESQLTSPFALLLRDVFRVLDARWPGDEAIRQHLVALPAWLKQLREA